MRITIYLLSINLSIYLHYIVIYLPIVFGLVGRVFAIGPGDLGSISGRVIPDFKNGTWYLLA